MADDQTLGDTPDDSAPEDWQTQARAAGYSWGDINGHVASASSAALDEGYTPPQVDSYLGYSDPAPATQRFENGFSRVFNDTPQALDSLASSAPKLDLTAGDWRGDYVGALRNKEVKGAEDFADGYASSALNAAHSPDRLDDSNGQLVDARIGAGARAANDLVGALPSNADFVDAALALDGGTSVTKDNLMRNWRDTGQSPIDAAIAAQNDPDLKGKLTSPPEKPEPYTQGMDEFQQKLKQDHPELYEANKDAIEKVSLVGLSADAAKTPEEFATSLGLDIATWHAFKLAEPYVAYYGGQALRYGFEKLLNVDPGAPIGQALSTIGRDIFADQAGKAQPLHTVSSVLARADEGAVERMEKGGVFNDLAARQASEIVSGDRIANPIEAFHASPHDFDSFSTEYLGTGEAGRAKGEEVNDINRRGNGLYFSTNPDIHDFYMGSLGTDQVTYRANAEFGTPPVSRPFDILDPTHVAAQLIDEHGSRQGAVQYLDSLAGDGLLDQGLRRTPVQKEALRLLKDPDHTLPEFQTRNSNDYRVKLHVTPDKLLDLDKSGMEQSEPVMKALDIGPGFDESGKPTGLMEDHRSGQAIFDELAEKMGGTKNASDFLASKGVTGTQYFDAASRSGGKAELKYWQDQLAAHEDAISKLPQMIADAKAGNELDFLPELKVKALEESLQHRQNSLSKVKDEIAKIEAAPDTRTRNYVMFHASPVEMFEKNGQAVTQQMMRQQTEALTEGYKAVNGLQGFLGKLFGDESGALNLFRTPQQQAASAAFKDSRAGMEQGYIQRQGEREQTIRQMVADFDPVRKILSPHMKEWESELAKGPAGNAMGTMVGQMVHYIEGRSNGVTLPPNNPLGPVADLIRDVNQYTASRMQAAEANGQITVGGYWQDYMRHLWKEPNRAEESFAGMGKLGTNASFKARTYPTIADGLQAGHVPLIKDPIELTLWDATSKLRYLDAVDQLDEAANKLGYVQFGKPDFGAPNSSWEKLNGGVAETRQAYADPGFARSWNNMVGRGMFSHPAGQGMYDTMTFAANVLTALKLFSPIFHMRTVALGDVAGGIAQSMEEAARGDFAKSLASLVGSPLRVVTDAIAGRNVNKAYLNGTDPAVQDLVKAGLRIKRAGTFQEMGRAPSIYDSLRWGSLTNELRADWSRVTESETALQGAGRFFGFFGKEFGRLMTVVNEPFFGKAIPTLQAGSVYRRYSSWLQANPLASEDAKFTYARKFVTDAENRMGELNLDTVFWPQMGKQLARLSMISPSWVFGTYRGIQGAGKSLAGLATGNIEKFKENSPLLTATAATGFGYMLFNAIEQFAYTGKPPESVADTLNFQTGGKATPNGQPRRGMLPSEVKEVYDLGTVLAKGWHDPADSVLGLVDYAAGKGNPLIGAARVLMSGELGGKDAIGHHISQQPGGWKRYFSEQFFTPIIMNQLWGGKESSGIPGWARVMGDREAPKWAQDWDDYQKGLDSARARITRDEISRARREESDRIYPSGYDIPTPQKRVRDSRGGHHSGGGP